MVTFENTGEIDLLSISSFGVSVKVASTLIEEFLHLRHGWKDMSRELQTFLFDKLVSLGEELNGEPL
jgi:hypothetical protein